MKAHLAAMKSLMKKYPNKFKKKKKLKIYKGDTSVSSSEFTYSKSGISKSTKTLLERPKTFRDKSRPSFISTDEKGSIYKPTRFKKQSKKGKTFQRNVGNPNG